MSSENQVDKNGQGTENVVLLIVFLAVAVAIRIFFWAYTGREFEDALISVTPARNLWEGFGLTHHPSEPRVHSFTSGLGEVALILGEGFGSGVAAMRITSILSAAAAIFFGWKLGGLLNFRWPSYVLLLGYLSLDHLQVFFGMSGMETQLATAIVLGAGYFYVAGKWRWLGVALGLAAICRPELLLLSALAGTAVLLWHRQHLFEVAIPALGIALAWFGFAAWYYGSPIPHTVIVKSSFAHRNLAASYEYLLKSWRSIAPFIQYWFVADQPLPELVLKVVSLVVISLSVIGGVYSVRTRERMLLLVLLLLGFVAYRTMVRINPYFMWYLPPFVAVLFVFASAGLNVVARTSQVVAGGLAIALFVLYAFPIFAAMPLDRQVQSAIEEGVRRRTGQILNGMMGPNDTVVLEPLGFIGLAIRPKTTYDLPGLSSPKAFAAFLKHRSMTGLIKQLDPDFVVQRPTERADFERIDKALASRYERVTTISVDRSIILRHWGLQYYRTDIEFSIYKRRD